MRSGDEFFNIHAHDLIRVAVATPALRVADPAFNVEGTVALMREAAGRRAALALFPELGLSAYTCDDLFQQRALLDGCLDALRRVVEVSAELPLVSVVGVPLELDQALYNCAAIVAGGRILGLVPKTYLPSYREFYETRQFAPADVAVRPAASFLGQPDVPFGTRLLFRLQAQPLATFHVEICEDLWTPLPPSSFAALAGATLLLNLSASNVTVGKAGYRHLLVAGQSARCLAAYLYSAAGPGESTTDLAWDGQALVYENGTLLAEGERFGEGHLVCADVDLERLAQDRMRQGTFAQTVARHREALAAFRTIAVPLELPRRGRLLPGRRWERFPYVPSDRERRDERCAEVYEIQAQGLAQRLRATGIRRVVIGVSGGLDSTQALLVCARAMDRLGYPREHVLAYTMPGFGTTARTLEQARRLMAAIGCRAGEIDIRPACRQMLADIDHPHARGQPVYDVTFENVQAGARTSLLFRLANRHEALVVGTGDLSELALGWCTYGVGDHMSHYAVNASVPKTLIRHVVAWVAESGRLGPEASTTLQAILATPISPELVPVESGAPAADTEAVIGPLDLQDFHLYYTLRFGYSPTKVAFLAWCAWHETYTLAEIRRALAIFLERFFARSQFKRSCMPNAPKVGSGGSLSPRGDWRAPSDATATAWLAQLGLVPDAD